MSDWLEHLAASHHMPVPDVTTQHGSATSACVLISVVRTRGSCPRDTGTRMIVDAHDCSGTIGGGHLEYQAIEKARGLLQADGHSLHIERFALGARLGQCCGGVVDLSFERIAAARPDWITNLRRSRSQGDAAILVTDIEDTTRKLVVTRQSCVGTLADGTLQVRAREHAQAMLDQPCSTQLKQEWGLLFESLEEYPVHRVVFGAGHVGRSLVHVLGALPGRICWIDSRSDAFPDTLADSVDVRVEAYPEDAVDELPAGSQVVIMTHSHALDQAICERVLKRDDLPWCGLIGSTSKQRQFVKRLLARGVPEQSLSRLQCPIGIHGIAGKHPAEIAIAVAAQMLIARQARHTQSVSGHQAA
ncbi:MAG: xanthine dehydrogenase accessory protein XdhC [Granulosicoccus sp.]|nr:xanthine dehydrogenase accessory protein XdhC [Granulosicoccus sp.]